MAGTIVTFYSYKGGTGRTMALANAAWILASNGKQVLVVDWDLEAPGLHRYLHPFLLDKDLVASPGVIDLMWDFVSAAMDPTGSKAEGWHEAFARILPYAISVDFDFPGDGTVDLVPAGRQDSSYAGQVSTFDWNSFYDRLGGGVFLESLKRDMRSYYDFVLIDSRTGVSDTSGICTVQFPDVLVNCFTASTQSIEGAAAVAHSVRRQRPKDELRILPVPMRVEDGEQDKLEAARDYWQLLHKEFVSSHPEPSAYWANVEVPYTPYYAYEEILAAIGDRPGHRRTVLAACESLVSYLTDAEIQALVSIPEFRRRQLQTRYHRADQALPNAARLGGPPRVFITYAYRSAADGDAVRNLWIFLRSNGVDARLDRPAEGGGQGWTTWLAEELEAADFILVVGTSGGPDPDGAPTAFGSRAEAELIEKLLHTNRAVWYGRVLPVLLPGGSMDDLPGYLGNLSDNYYMVSDYTVSGAEALLRVLTDEPAQVEPPLGQVPVLGERGQTAPVPPVLRHDVAMHVALTQDGQLTTGTSLAGTLLGEQSAPIPHGLGYCWEGLDNPAAVQRQAELGQALWRAMFDEQTTRRLLELIDHTPLGTVLDVVVHLADEVAGLPVELLRLPTAGWPQRCRACGSPAASPASTGRPHRRCPAR